MRGGLVPHILIFPASLSLPPMRGAAKGRAPTILKMTLFTPESPILSNFVNFVQSPSPILLATKNVKKWSFLGESVAHSVYSLHTLAT